MQPYGRHANPPSFPSSHGYATHAGGSPLAAGLVERGLVAPTSRILASFKRHLARPHLTHRIMRRRDAGELRDMVRVYSEFGRGLDPVHVAAVLSRLQAVLARLPAVAASAASAPGPDLAAAAEAVRLLVPTLERSLGPRANPHKYQYQFRLDAAAACLWALAKLPPAVRAEAPPRVLDALLQRATNRPGPLHEASPHVISLLLWSIAKLSTPHPSGAPTSQPSEAAAVAAVDAVVAARLSRARGSNTVWALLRQSSPAVVARLAASLGALGRLSPPLAEALADEFRYRMTCEHRLALKPFAARDLIGVARGFASVAAGSEPARTLLALLAAHVVSRGPHELHHPRLWRPEHLSHLAAAYAAAGVKHDGLFRALADAARERQGQFQGWALQELQQACAALGYAEPWIQYALSQQQQGQAVAAAPVAGR